MRSQQLWTAGFSLLSFLLVVSTAKADLHTWAINEVFSNAAGTVQFIEMREIAASNNQHRLATSVAFPNHTFDTLTSLPFTYLTDLPNTLTANKFFLMGTAAYDALPNSPTPDYIIPSNFFSVTDDTLTFSSSISVLNFDPGQLPLNNTSSLNANFTTGLNSPTNYAGVTGSVVAPEPSGLMLAAIASAALLAFSRRRKNAIAAHGAV